MNNPGTIKALRRTLTKIKATTAKIVNDAEYWNTSAGHSLNLYNQDQGQAALARKKGRLRGQVRRADAFSHLLDDETGSVVRAICGTTISVLGCCDHFSRWREWDGMEPLRRQVSLIQEARHLLKRRS